MEPYKGIDLAGVTADVEAELQAERRASVAGLVKALLQQAAKARKDIERLEAKVTKQRAHFDRIIAKVIRLRAGDWSVLPDPQKGDGQELKEPT